MYDDVKIFDAKYIFIYFGDVLKGTPAAVIITMTAFFAGLAIGLAAALVKIRKTPVLNQVVTFYTSYTRGTPLMVQLFLAYYGLPILLDFLNKRFEWNIDISRIPPMVYALVAFSVNTGAYMTETVRGAIEAVDACQYEAAYSIVMNSRQTLSRIVLPQSFLVALPNLWNTIIALLTDTSLAYVITVNEIMRSARLAASGRYRYFEAFLAAAIIYWIICIIMEIAVKLFEKRMLRKRGMA
jgi:His/Glu/Gln/Arg/opine family amino acid ABC transporter permease subunit